MNPLEVDRFAGLRLAQALGLQHREPFALGAGEAWCGVWRPGCQSLICQGLCVPSAESLLHGVSAGTFCPSSEAARAPRCICGGHPKGPDQLSEVSSTLILPSLPCISSLLCLAQLFLAASSAVCPLSLSAPHSCASLQAVPD